MTIFSLNGLGKTFISFILLTPALVLLQPMVAQIEQGDKAPDLLIRMDVHIPKTPRPVVPSSTDSKCSTYMQLFASDQVLSSTVLPSEGSVS